MVAHFSAPYAPQCEQVADILAELSKKASFSNVIFVQVISLLNIIN